MLVPKFNRYYLSEFISYNKAVIKLINDGNAITLKLDVANNAFNVANGQVEAAYAYQKDSPITKELEILDMDIDDCVMGIYRVVDGFSRHFDAATKNAANAILTCFNKYGTASSIASLNYNAETEVVDKLVNDFETDATLVAAISKLGLTTWVAHLKTANTNFKTKYAARTAQFANQPAQTALQLKPLAVGAYRTLITRLTSLNNLDDTKLVYKTVIDNINQLTQQYNTTSARRNSGGGEAGEGNA